MKEVMAELPQDERDLWERQIRDHDRLTDVVSASSMPPGAPAAFDPLRPVAGVESDEQNAIGLVRRGVRVAPFAESTPLVPLYVELGQPLPAQLKLAHEQQHYHFVLTELTFSLQLADDEAPDYAEFSVDIHDNVEGPRATRAIEMFPKRRDAHWFQAQSSLNVSLDASMAFDVQAAVPKAQAQLAAKTGVSAAALVGPFRVEVGHTELEVAGAGDRNISWRYRVRKALEGQNDFKSFLVLKVAQETKRVALRTNIGVRTYRRNWRTLWLRDHMPILRAHAQLEVELPQTTSARGPSEAPAS